MTNDGVQLLSEVDRLRDSGTCREIAFILENFFDFSMLGIET